MMIDDYHISLESHEVIDWRKDRLKDNIFFSLNMGHCVKRYGYIRVQLYKYKPIKFKSYLTCIYSNHSPEQDMTPGQSLSGVL